VNGSGGFAIILISELPRVFFMPSKKTKGITQAVLAVLIIVIIIVAAVAAYYYYTTTTSTSTTTGLSGHITVAAEAGYNDAALKKIAADFMAANPGTTVNVVTLSFDTALQSYETAFSANSSTYDVLYFPNVGYIGSIQQYLLNLNPYVSNTAYFPTSYNLSDVLPSMLAPFQINGNLYALPNTGDVMLFFYRPSFFNSATNQAAFQAQYGYALPNPATQTLTVGQTVDVANFFNGQHGSKYGIEMMTGPGDDDMIQSFLGLLGSTRVGNASTYGQVTAPYGDMFSSTGQILSNTTMFKGVLSDFVQLTKDSEDPLTATFTTVPGTFEAGDAPMMFYWSYPILFLGNASQSAVANDWAVAPTTPGGISETGGVGLGVFKYTQNLRLSLAFLEFSTTSSESVYYTTLDSLVPYRYSDFKLVPTSVLPTSIVDELLSSLKTSVQGPANIAYWPQVSTYFRGEVPNMVSGSETVAQGASKITAECVSAGATAYS
jgi:ABC-type glycerol-3-phosphate transport system substrate-binding protein